MAEFFLVAIALLSLSSSGSKQILAFSNLAFSLSLLIDFAVFMNSYELYSGLLTSAMLVSPFFRSSFNKR